MEPNEQNTQQSPGFGRSGAPHLTQSWNATQAFSGMVSASVCPHPGHRSSEMSVGSDMLKPSTDGRDRRVPRP